MNFIICEEKIGALAQRNVLLRTQWDGGVRRQGVRKMRGNFHCQQAESKGCPDRAAYWWLPSLPKMILSYKTQAVWKGDANMI